MASLTGKSPAQFYKDLPHISNSNTGIDATTRRIFDGAGNTNSILLSDDVVGVQPANDDTTGTFYVKKNNGSTVFNVDTTNSLVKTGAEQVNATTQYKYFSSMGLVPLAGSHMVLFGNPSGHYGTTVSEEELGSGTDPATTKDMSTGNDAAYWTAFLWYLPDAITLDAVHVFMAVNSATSGDLNYHLMSYDIDIGNGATSGDLSGGVVLADGSAITGVDRLAIDYQALTIQSSDVDSRKVILATVESTSTFPVSVNMSVKYHIR